MVVYTIEQRWEILGQIALQKMPILAQKKIIFSNEAHFDRVCKQAKLSHVGYRQPARRRTQNVGLLIVGCL